MVDYLKLQRDLEQDKKQRFYSSKAWKKLRAEVIKFDNYKCTKCGRIFKQSCDAVVHHVDELKNNPMLAMRIFDDDGNRQLITVCKPCHLKIHSKWEKKLREIDERFPERWD